MKQLRKGALIILLLLIATGVLEAALTYDQAYYVANRRNVLSGGNNDPLYRFIGEVEGILEGTTGLDDLYFTPTDTAPTAVEGALYASDADNGLKYYTGTAWVDIDVSGASSLATAYTAGSKILAPTLAVEIEVADGSNNAALLLDYDDATTNAMDVLQITNAGDDAAAVSIQIDGTAGYDIQGTGDTWQVGIDGTATLVGLTITTEDLQLENGGEIQNVVDTELRFMENSEDFILDFTTNGVTLKSGTGVVAIDFGAIDAFTGINTVAFDGAVANTITQTGTGAADDLTISQAASAQDASLILQSSGTGTDALSLISSVADIKINSADNIDIDAADNYTIDTADGSYTLTVGGATNGDITINAADKMDIDAADDITIDLAGSAGEDIIVTNTGGSIQVLATEADAGAILIQASAAGGDVNIDSVLGRIDIEAEENVANALLLVADGGTTTTLEMRNDTGTSTTEQAAAVQIEATVGSIELYSGLDAADAISIIADSSTASGILLFNDTGTGSSATTESDASIQLLSDAGGISAYTTGNVADAIRLETNGGTSETIIINNLQGTGADAVTISANAAGGNVDINSVLGSIYLEAEEDAADAILLDVDGGNSTTMRLIATTGTSVTEDAAAITINAAAGGINIQSDANLDDALVLRADGGTTSEITIHNDQGNATDSIDLVSDAGGIVITAAKPVVITNAFEPDIELVADATPYTVAANNSGQAHLIPDLSADTTFNMPAEADGMYYRFVYTGGAADAHDWIIQTGDDLKYFIGGVVQHDPDNGGDDTVVYYPDGDSNSRITVYTPESGTILEMWCDGTNWRITGTVISATDTGVAFADN
jgi:hypothetical protein